MAPNTIDTVLGRDQRADLCSHRPMVEMFGCWVKKMSYRKFAVSLVIPHLLSACCSPYTQGFCCKPMECEQAKAGFDRYGPIINALRLYKENHGKYPESMEQLQPQYIGSIQKGGDDRFTYSSNDGEYELSFTYFGPGANVCSYSSKISKWDCSGYF